MSLRLRIFLIFGGLIALLSLAQWLLVRSLTRDIDREADQLAVTLGRDFATVLDLEHLEPLLRQGQVAVRGEQADVNTRKRVPLDADTLRKVRLQDVEFRVPSNSADFHPSEKAGQRTRKSVVFKYKSHDGKAEAKFETLTGPSTKQPVLHVTLTDRATDGSHETSPNNITDQVWVASGSMVFETEDGEQVETSHDVVQVSVADSQDPSVGASASADDGSYAMAYTTDVEDVDVEMHATHTGDGTNDTASSDRPTMKVKRELWISDDNGQQTFYRFDMDDPSMASQLAAHGDSQREGVIFIERMPDLKPFQVHLEEGGDDSFLVLDTSSYSSRIPLTKHGMSQALQRLSQYLVSGSLLIVLVGLIAAGILAHRITRPLQSLAVAAQAVGAGHLGSQVRHSDDDPAIRQAIQAFNGMSLRLVELDALERQNRERQYMADMGEIARGLAHTIRNPLNTLGLSLEQMADMLDQRPEATELVTSSRRQISRIDRWIRSFLVLAADGKGEVQAIDIAALAEDVALEALHDNPGKVRIDLQLDRQLPRIQGIAAELRAVIQALVVNAIEASPKGGTVQVSATSTGTGDIEIQVQDKGPGMAAAVRQRLFTPHVTTKPQGSGMGLFLAHRITTHRYDGHIAIQDVDPQGTQAIIRFPTHERLQHAHSVD